VLTNYDGSKKFGYCRRFMSPPECYVIVSEFASFNLFSEILNIVELKRKEFSKSSDIYSFLSSLISKECLPGQTIEFEAYSAKNGRDIFYLTRDTNTYKYLDYVSYRQLFKHVTIKDILTILKALLLEMRIIMVSKNLSVLSSCILAIYSMIYPFSWQHVFIPILPLTLMEYAAAPVPFIIGILHQSLDQLFTLPLEEALIMDIDKGKFLKKPKISHIIPKSSINKLSTTLKAISKLKNRGEEKKN